MTIADQVAGIALAISGRFGVGYFDAQATWPGTPVKDEGGSIITPADPIVKTCSVQIDAVTEAMRGEAGYTDKDMRLLVLSATLDVPLDTDAKITMLAGPYTGTTWHLASAESDPSGIYWQCRGRAV